MANRRARHLRQRMTPQEVKLGVHLRTWRANGIHFRRQVPIRGAIVDFASLKHRLVVEVDGSGHARHHRIDADQARDARLTDAGFRIIRFWNRDVDSNLPGVLDAIHAAIEGSFDPTRPTLRAGHPPRPGEG